MQYSYLEDIVMMLVEMCAPMTNDEIATMMNIKVLMSKNKDFDKQYTAAVKSLYLKSFQTLQDKNCTQPHFADVNAILIEKIKDKVQNVDWSSICNKTAASDSAAVDTLRTKIIKLKKI